MDSEGVRRAPGMSPSSMEKAKVLFAQIQKTPAKKGGCGVTSNETVPSDTCSRSAGCLWLKFAVNRFGTNEGKGKTKTKTKTKGKEGKPPEVQGTPRCITVKPQMHARKRPLLARTIFDLSCTCSTISTRIPECVFGEMFCLEA